MYTIEYIGIPEKKEDLDSIFDLCCVCDHDFVPPLSSRESSTQHGFGTGTSENVKPVQYFEIMKKQYFVCARDESGKMVAFLTFKHNYTCDEVKQYGLCNYMSTACVYPEHRRHGLVSMMYDVVEYTLPADMLTDYVTTRTWSTNTAQVHAFPKRGYREVYRIPNDRGEGVDTIYYVKDIRNKQA